jgi:YidC/Oxa1 family membrane protein insertase
MSVPLLDDAVRIAYPIVWHVATALAPVGGAATAIALCTITLRALLLPLTLAAVRGERARARLAPRIRELRKRYAKQPDRLREELVRLHRGAGVSPLAGFLPLLLQAPFFMVTYRLFVSGSIGGRVNGLVHSRVFGAELSTRLLDGGHPLVFLPFLAALAGLAWLAVRRTRRLAGPDAPRGVLALLPFGTLLTALLVPLAGVVYVVTTTAWTAAENILLRRGVPPG